MSAKKNIAVIGGGDSSEWVISVKSAQEVTSWIDKDKFNVFVVSIRGNEWLVKTENADFPINRADFSFEKAKFDYAMIIIHGTPGENGILQSYFDLLRIPYQTCGVFTSALTFNKFACKVYLKEFGIIMADSVMVREGDTPDYNSIISQLGLPLFVKPNNAGSSFGVTKVSQKEMLPEALKLALKEDNEVIIEAFLSGTEITCGIGPIDGVVKNFPITEIVSKKDFFDFEAKYTTGMSEEITPARISDALKIKCNEINMKIYKALNCKGIVRIDYIIKDQEPYFLEINTVPGMSPNSIIPQQIRAMGLDITKVLSRIIEDGLNKS